MLVYAKGGTGADRQRVEGDEGLIQGCKALQGCSWFNYGKGVLSLLSCILEASCKVAPRNSHSYSCVQITQVLPFGLFQRRFALFLNCSCVHRNCNEIDRMKKKLKTFSVLCQNVASSLCFSPLSLGILKFNLFFFQVSASMSNFSFFVNCVFS